MARPAITVDPHLDDMFDHMLPPHHMGGDHPPPGEGGGPGMLDPMTGGVFDSAGGGGPGILDHAGEGGPGILDHADGVGPAILDHTEAVDSDVLNPAVGGGPDIYPVAGGGLDIGLFNPDINPSIGPANVTDIDAGVLDYLNSTNIWIFGETEDKIILPILLALLALFCFLGNGLVVHAVTAVPRMRTGANLMLLNIAICDLVFLAFCIPTAIINHASPTGGADSPGANACKFVHYVIFVTAYVAIYTLVVSCVFRFFNECMAEKSTTLLSRANAVISCFVIWGAFLVSHLNLLMAGDGSIFQEPFVCVHTSLAPDQAKLKTLWMTFLTCAFLLPLLSVCTLSAVVLHRQYRDPDGLGIHHNPNVHPHHPGLLQNNNNSSDHYAVAQADIRTKRDLTVVIMASLVVRTVCWVPIQVFVMIDVFGVTEFTEIYRKAEMLGVCFAFAGACVNPLIYNCASHDFNRAFKESLAKLGCNCTEDKLEDEQGSDMNETIMSIISDSSNHINYG